MKNDRLGRAGVLAVAVLGVLAASWVLPPAVHRARRLCPARPDGVSEAGAYASFARRYGVSCAVCHSSVPQLNETGYKFRTAGYRMPDEIGNDAKWSNWGDNMSMRTQETFNVAETKGAANSTPESNGFSNGGLEAYPLVGAFGKYTAANSEVDFTAGSTPASNINTTNTAVKGTPGTVSMNSLNMMATLPIDRDSFVTARAGLISAFQGYGASDRGVGILSPTFLPTPSQIQPGTGGSASFTYNGFAANGEGLELAYNWKGTHVSAQLVNGYNSLNGSAVQGEDNHLKDFGFYANQMIGESAIAAYFYRGASGYAANAATNVNNGIGGAEPASAPFAATWYDHYMRGILYATVKLLPSDKLDALFGICDGYDHAYDLTTRSSSDRFHSTGLFATLQSALPVWDQQLTTALSYGTSRASTATAGNRVSDMTLSFAVPIENTKFALDLQARRTQSVGSPDFTADIAALQWQFMY